MDEYLEQSEVEWVVMSTKTVAESVSCQSEEDTKCIKCESTNVFRNFIAEHEVLHCICECGFEWIE